MQALYQFKSAADKWATINALRHAAALYAQDAKNMADSPRVHLAFTDQMIAANRIADEIEQA